MPNRNLIVTLTLVLALSGIPLALAAEEAEPKPQQIIQQWAATFNKNDAELLSAFYDRSDELEVVVSAGVRHRGFDALKKAYVDDMAAVQFYDSAAIEPSTRILGDTAIVSFEHKFKARIKQDNSRWQIHIRTTTVLKRMDGEWKIVLEHSSPIMGIERFTPIAS